MAHRWFYEQAKGPIPDGLSIDHLCRVPPCVNPDHLEAVSHTENVRRGKAAKLTMKKANEIRRMHRTGSFTQAYIAVVFNIDNSIVSEIVNNKRWKI